MNEEEIVRRLVPVVGFLDDKTGLLYIQTPTSSFGDFVKLIEENER